MSIDIVFNNTVGGLGFFLFGMGLMSDGLKKAAGQKLRSILESMTRKPLMGFTMGALVTALVQSSSATTVMIIGLVNAGLMTLRQAICVVFGTNVGTTITAWVVSLTGLDFKITSYALPAVGVGFLIQVLAKKRKTKNIGQILLGFGILFVGIGFMKDAFGGLEESEAVVSWLTNLGGKPLLALFAGTAMTMLLQSSSASIAIVQLLAFNGAFGSDWENALNIAIPFVVGGNIGTTITAQIASVRSNVGARRTAWAHTMFNIIGAVIALPLIYLGWFGKFVHMLAPWELSALTIQPTIAIAHTTFNVANSVLCLPFAKYFERLVTSMIKPRTHEMDQKPVILERHLLDTPVLALQQAKREIIRMSRRARQAVELATDGLVSNEVKNLEKARHLEDLIDEFQHEITSYLVKLSQRQLDDEVAIELPVLLHMVNDLERVGDHAVNIVEIAERKIENKLRFTDIASKESKEMLDEVYQMFEAIVVALEKNDPRAAKSALYNENRLNRMQVNFRRSHVQRMTDGACSAQAGLIFIDLVDNIEKIGDHLANIAQSVIGGLQWAGVDGNTLSGEYEGLLDD
jgi:phosphate:Na+ symporter